jgi:hypothetical protein
VPDRFSNREGASVAAAAAAAAVASAPPAQEAAAPAAQPPQPAAAPARPSRAAPKAPRLEALDDVKAWEIRSTPQGRPYYVCAELGLSSWLMPPCLQALDRRVAPLPL